MNDSPLPPEAPDQNDVSNAAKPAAETPKQKPPNRFQRFLRSLLRWLVFALVLFLAGILTLYFTRVQPLEAQQKQLQVTQTAVQKQSSDLQKLRSDNTSLSSANQSMTDKLTQDQAHLELIRAMNNVNTARMYMAMNNPAEAKKALGPVKDELNAIATVAKDANLLKPISDRLDLVLNEMSNNSQTSASDLGIMNDQLVELEKKLFPSG